VPRGGITNAAVLNHRWGDGSDSLGSPTMFGRPLAPKPRLEMPVLALSKLGSSAAVSGCPF
jgi:hypothetical protein